MKFSMGGGGIFLDRSVNRAENFLARRLGIEKIMTWNILIFLISSREFSLNFPGGSPLNFTEVGAVPHPLLYNAADFIPHKSSKIKGRHFEK